MKKIFSILIYILFFSAFAFCSTGQNPLVFNIVLQRSGKTEYYFTEYENNTRLERVVFSLPDENGISTTQLGFVWSIYNTGTYDLDIIFQSAESVGIVPENGDFMIRHISSTAIGYNYNVIDKNNSGLSFESNSIDDPKPSDSRTYNVFTGKQIDRIQGDTGRVDLTLTLNPPTSSDGTKGFSEGQYRGEIVVRLTTGT